MQAFLRQFYQILPSKQHNFPPKLKKICLKLRIPPKLKNLSIKINSLEQDTIETLNRTYKLKNPANLSQKKPVKKACYIRFCLFSVKLITDRCWFNVVYMINFSKSLKSGFSN